MAAKLNLSLAVLAAAQLVAGLAMQFVVLIVIGAGHATDAFAAAQTVPMFVLAVFAVPLQNVWLPQFSVLAAQPSEWRRAQGVAQGQLMLLAGGVAAVLGIGASLWAPFVFPGLTNEQTQLTIHLTQILLLAALFNGQVALLTVALRARDRFITPELTLFLVTVAGVATTFFVLPRWGVLGAAWVSAGRSALVAGILYCFAERPPISLLAAVRDGELWQRVKPVLLGASFYKCEPLIDRFWASQSSAGGLTVFALAQTGMGAIGQILERSVCMPMAPRLARLAEAKDHAGMRSLYRNCLWRVTLLMGACLVGLLIVHPIWPEAMHRVFKLPQASATQMWLICLALLGFVHVVASGAVPVAAFYALGDTRTPVKLSMIAFVIGIGLKSIGFITLGLPGLALGTSVYYLGNLITVSLFLERRLRAEARPHQQAQADPVPTAADPRREVTLVTVTYGRRWHLLQQVLDSAFEQGAAEAIVIDNGSQDDIATLAHERHGAKVRIVQMGRNTGSAKAFHVGITEAAASPARFILLLDDDNKLEPGALDALLAAHEKTRREQANRLLIVLGFRPGNQFEIAAGAKRRILPRNAFLGFDLTQVPDRLWRRLRPARKGPVPAFAQLDVAPYGGMLFDKALIAEIGLPNPDFVLYADDTEFSYRVTKRGGQLLLVTGARVSDIETSWNLKASQGSAFAKWLQGGSDLSSYYALRNRVCFETHHVDHFAAWRWLNRLVFLTALRWTSRRLGTSQRLALLLQAVRDGESRQLGVKPGLELQ